MSHLGRRGANCDRGRTVRVSPQRVWVLALFAWMLLVGQPGTALAQSVELPTASQIQERIAQLKNPDNPLAESVRGGALELLQQTGNALKERAAFDRELAALQQRLREAPAKIKQLKADIDGGPSAPPALDDTLDLPRLRSIQAERQAELLEAERRLGTAEDDLRDVDKRAATLGTDIEDRRRRLELIRAELEQAPPDGEAPAFYEARNWALLARRASRQVELNYYERYLESQQTLARLAGLERDAAVIDVARAQGLATQVRELIQRRLQSDAQAVRQAAEATQADAVSLPDAVQGLADTNVEYGKRLEALTLREAQIAARTQAAKQRLHELRSGLESTKSRVQIVGSSAAIARMLRRRLAELPSTGGSSSERRDELGAITDQQIDLEELRREHGDEQHRLQGVTAQVSEISAGAVAKAASLLRTERELLDGLAQALLRQIAGLTALDAVERELAVVSAEYRAYLREELLWAQSATPIDFDDLGDFARTGLAVLNPLHWWDVWRAAIEAPSLRPGRLVIGVLLILAAILLARGARQRLHDIVDPMRRIRTDSFRYTLYALFQTVFIALPVSLSMAVLGWSLQGAENRVVDALGHGFIATAAFALTLRVLQAVLVDEGLAQSHFRWPDQVRRPLRAVSIWLLWCGVPLVLAIETLTVLGDAELTTGLARPAFVLWMILITASLWRLLRPSGSVSRRLAESSLQMMAHTRFLWVPAVLATPLALAALSLLGYHHTALEFGSRLVTSLWVLIGVLIGRSLLLRSFYVVERRLRFDDALKRREEARALRQSDDNAAEAEFGAMPDEPEVDYQDLGEQARRLVDISTLVLGVVGIWFVWSDLVPALRVLDNVHLPLSATDIVDGVEKEVPVTLSDVVFALGALFMTLFAAKNLTGLLEIVLLQRLPLDTGGRYAIATLSKYAIVAIGLVVTLNAIGLDWSNIQWLVAALSVGLGFGLQEIVANFISGIILLVERPIRPGDVVTIGDTVGTVARIRIRATTVVNYDRQELLVPNKEFITGRLLNWTLSDQLNRIVIPVGVAYGSNTSDALALLESIANEHGQILSDPAPISTFEGFGDNTLNLTLRCYLGSLEYRLSTITDLHTQIHEQFTAAGLEIAFPQRDVHLDTTRPLEILLSNAGVTPKV